MKVWLILSMLLAGCSSTKTLTILHTNDIHGHFAAERAAWRQDSAWVGGFPALSGALDSVRAADEHTVYLDAGDLMTGNPICNFEVDGLKGAALINMLDLCGCEAISVGNHEFDLGPEHTKAFVGDSRLDWLCGNVFLKDEGTALCASHKIIERGGLRIGVIGVLLTDLAGVVSKTAIEDFVVRNIAEISQSLIDTLDPQTDLIVLLTHNGVDNDKRLAEQVTNCDLIIGGHSHTRLKEPLLVNDVIIVQAGSFLKNLGVLKLQVKNDRIANYKGVLIELEAGRFTPAPEVESYCAGFEEQINREFGEVIASTTSDLTRAYDGTSPLGNLLCDLLKDHYTSDFAIVNSGGIRKDVPAGPIRKLDIVEMLPFMNSLTSFEASGEELQTFAERQARAQVGGDAEALQMSGLVITYGVENNEPKNITVQVNGSPLELNKSYKGISIDYVLKSQAEKYLGFQPREMQDMGVLFSDFIMMSLAAMPQPITPKNEVRLIKQ